MSFSLAVLHKAESEARVKALDEMFAGLDAAVDTVYGQHGFTGLAGGPRNVAARVFSDPKPKGEPWNVWQHTLHPRVWHWALSTTATHHVFMTDDLHISPHFWDILAAMVSTRPASILGLLSNHPASPRLANKGARWYRTCSWVVGPCYVVPRVHLRRFLAWYEDWLDRIPRNLHGEFGDDSALNEWNRWAGTREVYHPVPTIIEHRGDVESTWSGGDCYSRERVSWRAIQTAPAGDAFRGEWTRSEWQPDLSAMRDPAFWRSPTPPMLRTVNPSEDEVSP